MSEMAQMAATHVRHRVDVEEYHRMAEAGVFDPERRIELIEGELIETVAPMKEPHAVGLSRLMVLLVRCLAGRATIRCQSPVTLSDDSEPEPDFAVVRPEPRDYLERHPRPADAYLLIEVADSSRAFDQRRKIPLYGRCGVAETWLVDLVDDRIVAYRDPGPGGYATTVIATRGESLAPLAFRDERFDVSEILPAR